jgi:hypothetical protein
MLFLIFCQVKDCTIKDVLDADFVISFRTTLRGDILGLWHAIKWKVLALNLSLESISWSLNPNKIFSTKLFQCG